MRSVLLDVGSLAAIALVGAGCAYSQAASERDCARAVLVDWSDGRFDRVYAAPCYLAAIDGLPEDVRAYTTAKHDIARELYASRSGR